MPGQKIYILLFTLSVTMRLYAQSPSPLEQLPINTVPAAGDSTKPLVLYITGDGGWNKFSKNLSQAFADKGYPVVALNAKDYFWKKKTPTQAATDITSLIKAYQVNWKRKKIILLGYSFGADVMPFVFNLLPTDLSTLVANVNLLSDSIDPLRSRISTILSGVRFTVSSLLFVSISKRTFFVFNTPEIAYGLSGIHRISTVADPLLVAILLDINYKFKKIFNLLLR